MKASQRTPAKFARKALPAAVALVFGHAAWAGINDGGNTANLPTGGNGSNVSAPTFSDANKTMSLTLSGRSIIDWATFSIGATYKLKFDGAGHAVLNRVAADLPGTAALDRNMSKIAGALEAPGVTVVLMNPNGIAFMAGAQVNVGSLVATTGQVNQNEFTATGDVRITYPTGYTREAITTAAGSTIQAAGLAALVAPSVTNAGTITAAVGKVVLAGNDAVTITMNGLYDFDVTGAGGVVTNAAGGSLSGKTILLTTGAAAGVLSGTINLHGVQHATDAIVVNGNQVVLTSNLVVDAGGTISGSSNTVTVQTGAQIQDGIDIVKSAGLVNVGAGTFAEGVSIKKALTLDGAGKGKTIINPGSSKEGILVEGGIGQDASVTITDLTVQGGSYGIRAADNANLGTLTIDGVVVRDNLRSGFISASSAKSTVSQVNILNSVFAGNGDAGGSADINLFFFNGNALIKNVDILGTRSGTPNLDHATDYGIQLRGFGDPAHTDAAGTVKLENVRIAGNYRRAHLGIQRYSDASGITMSGVQLGGGFTSMSVGKDALGNDVTIGVSGSKAGAGFGTFFSSEQKGALSLGDTVFLASANPFDIGLGNDTASMRVNATGVTFKDDEGHLRTDNFAIEGRVSHAIDSTDSGLVTWNPGNLYVTNDRSIQRGINLASVGDTVNVQGGTSTVPAVYAENLSISKALTLKGAGAGSTVIDPVSNDALTVSGNIGDTAVVTIDGFTFRGAPRYGVKVAGDAVPGTTVLGELVIRNSVFLQNGQNGLAVLGDKLAGVPGLGKVTLENDKFVGNGNVGTVPISSLGYGDILFDFYNGDAKFKNVQITGAGEFIGIQMRGPSLTPNHPSPAGTVEFDGVTIDGSFLRPNSSVGSWNPGGPGDAIHLLEYSSVANVSFKDVTINLAAGHGMFLEGLGTTLNIGNTVFGLNTNLAALGSGTTITDREKVSRNIFVGSNDNGFATKVDASHATFTGASDGFAIENRVYHALDTTGLGLVTWNPGHLYVTADSGSIQRGINAACTCDTVHVDKGTFTEQLTINKSLILLGSGDDTIVKAPTSLVEDSPGGFRNILTIRGLGTDAEVSGFTFKGPVLGLDNGIFVRDGAHAYIHHNSVLDIRDATALSGTQRGNGIRVGSAALVTYGTATIEDNFITGYQKTGIVVDGPGSDATIKRNTVIGAGATDVIAQNGIQASRGASARIQDNTVSGHRYTPTTDEATGILIFTPDIHRALGEIIVGPNTVTDNEIGVWTNDPRSLTRIDLSGVANSNSRKAVADFGDGFKDSPLNPNLAYSKWAPSNVAMVNGTTFSSASGDVGNIVDAGGVLRVTGWDGFAAIQPAIEKVAPGGTVNVGPGTYAENVVLNGVRNLMFGGTIIEGLTINDGAAGSGIGGSVTATGPTGFLFNVPVRLLSDTSLVARGGNIVLNGDVQGANGAAFALSLDAGGGDVSMVTGGTQGNPLGHFNVLADDFSLASTLWVSGYDINAAGNVALSDHTLNSVGALLSLINAGGNVTGSTTSQGSLQISGGGDVITNIISLGNVAVVATNVGGNITGGFILIGAENSVNASVNSLQVVEITSGGTVNVSGSAQSLVLNAPTVNASGSFGEVVNSGGGAVSVNGRLQRTVRVVELPGARIVPTTVVTAADSEAGANTPASGIKKPTLTLLTAETKEAQPSSGLSNAAELLRQGQSVEIDLTPGNN